MSIFNTVKQIAFADNNTALLQSALVPYHYSRFNPENVRVAVWNLADYTLRFTCPGRLIGTSLYGETFLTQYPPDISKLDQKTFRAWNTQTGAEIPLNQVDPESYSLHQKTFIYLDSQARQGMRIYDILTGRLSPPYQISKRPGARESPETWAISPDDKYLLVAIRSEAHGRDFLDGVAIKLNYPDITLTAKKVLYKVNDHLSDPLFNFSVEHNLFAMSDGNSSVAIHQLSNWKTYRVSIGRFNNAITIHPYNKNLLVACTQKSSPERKRETYLTFIEVDPQAKGVLHYVQDTVIAEVQVANWVDKLLFHPNGNYVAGLIRGKVYLWDTTTKEQLAVLSPEEGSNA